MNTKSSGLFAILLTASTFIGATISKEGTTTGGVLNPNNPKTAN